jgi:hypothetical protein
MFAKGARPLSSVSLFLLYSLSDLPLAKISFLEEKLDGLFLFNLVYILFFGLFLIQFMRDV